MFQKEINFDRFVRGAMLAGVVLLLGYAIHALSSVLLPFVLAWMLAYMLNPVVTFLQTRCRLRLRWLSVTIALLLLCAILVGVLLLIVPPSIEEFKHLKGLIIEYLRNGSGNASIPTIVSDFIREHLENEEVRNFLQTNDVQAFLRQSLERIGNLVWATANAVWKLFSWCITLLYLFFLLMDFEKASKGWINYVPKRFRESVDILAQDVQQGMSAYFRGQALVALCVGILFAIGFFIIDLPLAIGFGLFVGALNFVPYLQMISIPMAVLLALLKAAETGENFWGVLLLVALVYVVAQLIQDLVIVPRIMGRIMGLSPALILLSLSIWGYLLGFLGLIIALPLTTLILSYYKRYIIKD
ncbi:MAG: AI-2E family transporter [Bacteroidaceae bacterium]|nr:AI-2E family transporter [Bacteroidaceae bacterium]